jgi:hypothetical protein
VPITIHSIATIYKAIIMLSSKNYSLKTAKFLKNDHVYIYGLKYKGSWIAGQGKAQSGDTGGGCDGSCSYY